MKHDQADQALLAGETGGPTMPPPGTGPALRQIPWRTSLDVVGSVGMLAAAVYVVLASVAAPPDPAPPRSEVVTEGGYIRISDTPILGSPHAPIGIVEVADFECQTCSEFATTVIPELRSRYIDTGKVQLAFRHRRLPRAHPEAGGGAVAAHCAHEQGRFWDMYSQLQGATVDRVSVDDEITEAFGLTATPALLIGAVNHGAIRVSRIVRGPSPFATFAATLEELEQAVSPSR